MNITHGDIVKSKVKFLQILWAINFLLSASTLVNGQSFCLSNPSINKQRTESYKSLQVRRESCKLYWINIYIHRVQGYGNGWGGYNSTIDIKIMENLNSSFNQYGFYFELSGARDWFTNIYTDPNREPMALLGIFDDPKSLQHTDAIDIYLLPSNSKAAGGFVPSNNKKAMVIGGTRTVNHCSGDFISYKVAATKVVSHEMGHCLGLPHTFNTSVGTSVDYVTENACVDPNNCQFVSNCIDCNVSSNPTTNMTNFMSYTIPNCMSVLSDEQVSLMREKLNDTMASVVDRTKGLPSDIIGDLIGPSEVVKGSLIRFNVSDQVEESEAFVWTMPAGFLRTGGVDTSRSVKTWIVSGAESGEVSVWKTNFCGNSDTKYKYVTVILDDCMVCPIVKILPNPAFDEIFISYSSRESGDQVLFKRPRGYMIVDSQGKTVYKYNSRQTNLILDLSRIKNGVYILNIKYGNLGSYQFRFIIAR